MHVSELPTPALVVERAVFDRNVARMTELHPARRLRPHVKAFKSTALARELAAAGHTGFCCVIGLPRCGCDADDAGRLADRARAAGMEVRGVMGYEGHVNVLLDREERRAAVEQAMTWLLRAHDLVGGDVVSGGGTMTAELNEWVTEVQAGTYVLMDTSFEPQVPFEIAIGVEATVISVSPKGWAVADAGLKAFGMDSGKPSLPGADVWIVSDEHVTFTGLDVSVGDRVRFLPAHLDPTVAKHERMWVLDGDEVVDEWPVDLRGW